MPSPVNRRHRHLAALAAAVLTLGLLTGCMGQRDADDYGDDVRRDFIAGCDGSAFDDEPNRDALQEGSRPTEECEAAYDCIEENVPFDDFKRVNSDLRDEPGPMDPVIMDALAECGIGSGSGSEGLSPTDDEGSTDGEGTTDDESPTTLTDEEADADS